jgi:predicted PurR-regulated permease PerM
MDEKMITPPHQEEVRKSLEVTIKVGLAVGLVFLCFLILKPFILLVLWGIIIAVSVHPLYFRLGKWLKGRFKWSAFIVTLFLLLIILTPGVFLGKSLAGAIIYVIDTVSSGQAVLPPPDISVQSWPLIGKPLFSLWQDAYTNLSGFIGQHSNQVIAGLKWLLGTMTGAGLGLLMFLASIIISGFLLVFSGKAAPFTYTLFERLMGKMGRRAVDNSTATIRNVIRGVLGIAFIQSVLAGISFLIVGIPAAGLWAFLAFFLCIIQIGVGPVVIPAVIYVFVKEPLLTAILFAIWSVFILVIDNFLKPILMGRKAPAPMLVVFLGVVGGFIYFGIVGLFVGAVILSLGYRLFLTWLYGEQKEVEEPGA